MWTIYDHPLDEPGHWVVVENGVSAGGIERRRKLLAVSLDHARSLIPPGLTNLGRSQADDPVIYEVWI
jgi:hypothetical protein